VLPSFGGTPGLDTSRFGGRPPDAMDITPAPTRTINFSTPEDSGGGRANTACSDGTSSTGSASDLHLDLVVHNSSAGEMDVSLIPGSVSASARLNGLCVPTLPLPSSLSLPPSPPPSLSRTYLLLLLSLLSPPRSLPSPSLSPPLPLSLPSSPSLGFLETGSSVGKRRRQSPESWEAPTHVHLDMAVNALDMSISPH